MKKVARIVGICSREVQRRYLAANEEERAALQPVIDREKEWMIEKLARKGYRLEATVANIYGIFTRGAAREAIRLLPRERAEVSVSAPTGETLQDARP